MALFVAGRAVQGSAAGSSRSSLYVVVGPGLRRRAAAPAVRRHLRRLGAPGARRPAGGRRAHRRTSAGGWVFLGLLPLIVRRARRSCCPRCGGSPSRRGPPPARSPAGGGRVLAGLGIGALQYAGQRLDLLGAVGIAVAGLAAARRRAAPAAARRAPSASRPGCRPSSPPAGCWPGLLRHGRAAAADPRRSCTATARPRPGIPLTAGALGWATASQLQGRRPDASRVHAAAASGFVLLAAGLAGTAVDRRPRRRRLAGLPDLGGGRPRHGARACRAWACCCSTQSPEHRRGRRLRGPADRRRDRLGAVRRARRRAGRGGHGRRCCRCAASCSSPPRSSPRWPSPGRWWPRGPARSGRGAGRARPARLPWRRHDLPGPRGDDADAARGAGGDDRAAGPGRATPRRCTPAAAQARRVAEQSRERLAEALGARPSEVLFTGGGTESDNLAVKGLYWARRAADPRRRRIVASPAEHHAVLDSVEWLAKHDGAEVTWLPVEPTGRVTPEALAEALGDGTRRRRRQRDVGQQRDRHGQRHRRAGRGRPRGRRAAAHRRGAGGRPGAGRLRRQRRRRADHDRAQARRPDGRRRAAAAPRRRVHAAAARRRPGARRPLRHARRRRDRRAGRRPRRPPSATGTSAPPGWPRCATGWSPASSAQVPDAQLNGPPLDDVVAGGPGRLPGQRAPVLPRRRGRRAAHAARRPRHRVLDRVGVQRRRGPAQPRAAGRRRRRRTGPAARCASASATPPPTPTSTRCSR